MYKKALFFGIGVTLLAAPFVASAATINDLQSELNNLLSQIASLQIGASSSATVSANSGSSLSGTVVSSSCPAFTRSLSVGSRGSDVTALQQFLVSQEDLSVSPTGYFGALT